MELLRCLLRYRTWAKQQALSNMLPTSELMPGGRRGPSTNCPASWIITSNYVISARRLWPTNFTVWQPITRRIPPGSGHRSRLKLAVRTPTTCRQTCERRLENWSETRRIGVGIQTDHRTYILKTPALDSFAAISNSTIFFEFVQSAPAPYTC